MFLHLLVCTPNWQSKCTVTNLKKVFLTLEICFPKHTLLCQLVSGESRLLVTACLVDAEGIEIKFADPFVLMRDLQGMGENNAGMKIHWILCILLTIVQSSNADPSSRWTPWWHQLQVSNHVFISIYEQHSVQIPLWCPWWLNSCDIWNYLYDWMGTTPFATKGTYSLHDYCILFSLQGVETRISSGIYENSWKRRTIVTIMYITLQFNSICYHLVVAH